jgi:hypothetical protein
VGLEFCVRERSHWVHPAVDHRRIPRSHASLSDSAGKEAKGVKIANISHDGSIQYGGKEENDNNKVLQPIIRRQAVQICVDQ